VNFAFVADPTVGAAELEASAIAANIAITITISAPNAQLKGRPYRRDRAVCCDSRFNMLLLPVVALIN
jgi:hypothetical protein